MSLSASEGAGLSDPGSFQRRSDGLRSRDPLGFPGYADVLELARDGDPERESVVAGAATIGGHEVELALFDFSFLGGSMGEVAGERLARAMERAAERRVAFVLRTTTGGARMQEGMTSLAQMAKLTVARGALEDAGCPFICVLGNPTTGGVFASLASVADVAIAERGSTIGFAGPRMVEHFTGHEIGSTSHTAASAFAAGLIDGLVDGSEIRAAVTSILGILRADDPHPPPPPLKRPARQISAWDAVQAIRSADRPHGPDLVREWADGFMELHGDRAGQDDEAVFCCVARPGGRRAAIVALDRRRWPGPGGYRKARRTFSLARRLKLPLVTIVDTNGADPSERSESSGIASEIGKTLEALLSIEVPTLCVVTGEGGSGGALALAVSDHLAIYRDAIFSVLSPELAAEILWRDAAQAREAADALDPTAHRLVETGIADEIVDDDLSGRSLEETVGRWLTSLSSLSDAATSGTNITQLRRKRWRLDAL